MLTFNRLGLSASLLCTHHHAALLYPASGFLPFERARASNGDADDERLLDQFYTRVEVAERLVSVFSAHYDLAQFQVIEPSAGTGSFLRLLPAGTISVDVAPKFHGIRKADFLTVQPESDRPIAVIGNPPFGRNSSMAVKFFNHAARWASVIAMIHPRTFRKASVENRLDPAFHLIREDIVPRDAFLFKGKPYDVPALFQIWERRSEPRARRLVQTSHPDFSFTTPDEYDFVIQRVGARAGRVHHDRKASPSAHYFIKGPVERVMRKLNFAGVVGNVAGNPSLAKSELIELYCAYLQRSGGQR